MRPPHGLTIQRPVLTGHNRPVQPTGTGLGWFGLVECSDVEYQRPVSVRSFQKRKEDQTELDFQALLAIGTLIGLKSPPCHHPGQRPLPLSLLSYPKIKLTLHRISQGPCCEIFSCKNLLSGQGQTRTTGNLHAWPALEGYNHGNYSQRQVPGSDVGKNTFWL